VEGAVRVAAAAFRQLEDRTVAARAAREGRAEEIAAAVHEQAGVGRGTVRTRTREAVKSVEGVAAAALHQLEHHAAVARAATAGRAEEVAAAVHEQGGVWQASVITPREAVEGVLSVAATALHQLEHRTGARATE